MSGYQMTPLEVANQRREEADEVRRLAIAGLLHCARNAVRGSQLDAAARQYRDAAIEWEQRTIECNALALAQERAR